MIKSPCSEDACTEQVHAQKRCNTHYRAWHRAQKKCVTPGCKVMQAGHLRCRPHERLALTEGKSAELQQERLNRFRASIEPDHETGCWIWTAATNPDGYGTFSASGAWLAHRFAYVWFVGGHGRGKDLDHLCNNIVCVRPDHLWPITATNNTSLRDQRALSAEKDFFRHARITPRYLSVIRFAANTGLPSRKPQRREDAQSQEN